MKIFVNPLKAVAGGNSLKPLCSFCRRFSVSRKLNSVDGKHIQETETQDSTEIVTKRLDIAIVGHPNAGKSTLVNNLCGKHIMPVSSKVHTTRAVMQGFLTKDDTQLIFWDTPGLVTSKQAKRHKLPSSIFNDPRNAFLQCDVIALVVDCVDHKHTNKIPPVLKEQLAKLFSTPSLLPDKEVILLLNKIDLFKGSEKQFRRVVQILTEGIVGGRSIETLTTQNNPGKGLITHDFSSHLGKKFKRSMIPRHGSQSVESGTEDETNSASDNEESGIPASQVLGPSKSLNVCNEQTTILNKLDRDDQEYFEQLINLKKRRGFNGFSAVFQLSALEGFGMQQLNKYFLQKAKPGRFEVKDGIYTNASLEKVVQNAIMSRVFENLPQHAPYRVNIELQDIFETESELFIIAVLITPSQMGLVLGENANTLRRIISESNEVIKSIVEVPVKLSLTVEERFYPRPAK